jgi:rhodanese-related sulfurtransferase
VREVQQYLEAGKTLHMIDVREPHEFATAKIEGAVLIPMRTVPAELQDLEAKAAEAPLIVFCHHGMRSMQVARFLQSNGFAQVINIDGGIDAWSAQVDASIPRY